MYTLKEMEVVEFYRSKERTMWAGSGWKAAVIVPAGVYFLGDPCYAFSHSTNTWSDLLESSGYFSEGGSPVGKVNGGEVLGFGTAYGDGNYPGSNGYYYSVDAGLIGLVPVDLIEDDSTIGRYDPTFMKTKRDDCGTIVVFNEPTECINDGGNFIFGDIEIITQDEEEDEEDEWWSHSDEEDEY